MGRHNDLTGSSEDHSRYIIIKNKIKQAVLFIINLLIIKLHSAVVSGLILGVHKNKFWVIPFGRCYGFFIFCQLIFVPIPVSLGYLKYNKTADLHY